jgi:hypothetical protein
VETAALWTSPSASRLAMDSWRARPDLSGHAKDGDLDGGSGDRGRPAAHSQTDLPTALGQLASSSHRSRRCERWRSARGLRLRDGQQPTVPTAPAGLQKGDRSRTAPDSGLEHTRPRPGLERDLRGACQGHAVGAGGEPVARRRSGGVEPDFIHVGRSPGRSRGR